MKKAFFILLIFISPAFSYAQESIELKAEVNINAQIIRSIDLITINTMTFGNAQPGQERLYVNPINDVNSGFMVALGTPGAAFRLDYLNERRLTQIDGPGFLIFRYELSGNSVEEQSSSELLEVVNRNLQFNGEGRYYFWVGGEVNIENALPGNYEGDFTIEIDYI